MLLVREELALDGKCLSLAHIEEIQKMTKISY
jgi:hypothetical protein